MRPLRVPQRHRHRFANFYWKLIRNFGHVGAPLHALTSFKVQVSRSSLAKSVFQKLKSSFVAALVLTVPDISLQFMVEVGASDFGSGVVLSQQTEKDIKSRCLFVSQVFSYWWEL